MALAGLALTAACAQPFPRPDFRLPDGAPVQDVAGFVREFWPDPDPVPPEARTWRSIHFHTAVTGITADTVRIEARGAPLTGIETVELRLLARAAAEGIERGYDYFEITHLRDRNYASAGRLFGVPLHAGRHDPIGSYTALAESRYERDWSAAPRAWTHPGLTAVVEYTDEPPTRHRERFEAGEVYRNLVSDGDLE